MESPCKYIGPCMSYLSFSRGLYRQCFLFRCRRIPLEFPAYTYIYTMSVYLVFHSAYDELERHYTHTHTPTHIHTETQISFCSWLEDTVVFIWSTFNWALLCLLWNRVTPSHCCYVFIRQLQTAVTRSRCSRGRDCCVTYEDPVTARTASQLQLLPGKFQFTRLQPCCMVSVLCAAVAALKKTANSEGESRCKSKTHNTKSDLHNEHSIGKEDNAIGGDRR